MFPARLIAVVNSALAPLAIVPAASNCTVATTPTPMITVTIAASMSVKPRRGARLNGLWKMGKWCRIVRDIQ
jgi:hypothetical protein